MELHGNRTEPQELPRPAVLVGGGVLSLAASTRDPARQLIAVGYENGVTHVGTLQSSTGGYYLRTFYSPPVMSVAFVETESAIYVVTAAGRGFRLFTLGLSPQVIIPTVEIYNHTVGAVVNDIAVSMGGQ
jgi:hypothetical protein